jgi:hypothetical protein
MNASKSACALAIGLAWIVPAVTSAGEPLAKALSRARAVHSTDECGGENCAAVLRGLMNFVDRRLAGMGGNGRACADCHLPADSLQLSPASAQVRYREWQKRRARNTRA